MWWFRRRDPEPVEPAKGVGVWTLDDVIHGKQPEVQETVTEIAPGVHFHSLKYAPLTEAQREAAETKAITELDRAMAPGPRFPVVTRRPSIFGTSPDPDQFPS